MNKGFIPIFENTLRADYFPLDLSVENKTFTLSILENPDEMQDQINQLLNEDHRIPYGGYFEKRRLYERSEHFGINENRRNIHLGVDFWSKEGTGVLCPYDGVVHSFKNNTNFGDYGPTIVLKHSGLYESFYTLYGHLSLKSIKAIRIGDRFKTGELLAHLGSHHENGNYAPHLHFQLIKDIGEYKGDYPGVCSENDRVYFSSNCPDPKELLGL